MHYDVWNMEKNRQTDKEQERGSTRERREREIE